MCFLWSVFLDRVVGVSSRKCCKRLEAIVVCKRSALGSVGCALRLLPPKLAKDNSRRVKEIIDRCSIVRRTPLVTWR